MMNGLENLGQLSIEVGEILFGSFFLLIGIISIGIALIRRGKDFKILVWLALWTGIYGI